MSNTKFEVITTSPWTVKYTHVPTGQSKIVDYSVALLPLEMEEEAKYTFLDV
jgi:hypothetical protein